MFEDIMKTCSINTFNGAPVTLGIDEAGRGPVLGPMVYAAFYCPETNDHVLSGRNVRDSKTLAAVNRCRIFKFFNDHAHFFGWNMDILMPKELSAMMLKRNKHNLNEISQNCAINLITKTLEAGVNVTNVYVDTVGKIPVYESKLKTLFPQLNITVAEKADSKYIVVSAASICAKVMRDYLLQSWVYEEKNKEFSREFGSGYTSDPITRIFLKNSFDKVFGYPNIVRFSWETAKQMIKVEGYKVQWSGNDSSIKKTCRKDDTNYLMKSDSMQSINQKMRTNRFLQRNGITCINSI